MEVRNLAHPLLPRITPEERCRQRTVVALRRVLNRHVRATNLAAYETEGLPAFRTAHGRDPATPEEIARAFEAAPSWRLWSAMNRAAQEMLWLSVGEPLLRDGARIRAEAQRLAESPARRGTLTLDPSFAPPAELAGTDVHLQPGGYALDRGEGDVLAGALYENGGNVYSFGQGVGRSDSKAAAVIRHLAHAAPGWTPRRVLEIGCSAGAASCAYAAHWPESEIHAIDVGAGMLRYAHARAEALGVRVHFHQMDGARLRLPDGGFDLVVSNNLLHEIGREERRAMFREARRVARVGGLVVHQDVPIRALPDAAARVERDWDSRYNGELYWSAYAADDLAADMRAAGFAAGSIAESRIEKVAGAGGWYLLAGRVE